MKYYECFELQWYKEHQHDEKSVSWAFEGLYPLSSFLHEDKDDNTGGGHDWFVLTLSPTVTFRTICRYDKQWSWKLVFLENRHHY